MKPSWKKTLLVAVSACICALKMFGASEKDTRRAEEAWLERIPHADLGNGYFRNPVLGPGSDNTVVKVGSDYYMMAGGGWPDQLIWHSRDLVNWAPIVRTLRKFDGGAWASDLTYYKGKFYIYTTQMDPSRGNVGHHGSLTVPMKAQGDKAWKNVVMWADHIEGPWSDPIDLGVYGLFDPGHVVDQQGNRYLYFNKGMLIRLTPDGLSAVGDSRKLMTVGTIQRAGQCRVNAWKRPSSFIATDITTWLRPKGGRMGRLPPYVHRSALQIGAGTLGEFSLQSPGAHGERQREMVAPGAWNLCGGRWR